MKSNKILRLSSLLIAGSVLASCTISFGVNTQESIEGSSAEISDVSSSKEDISSEAASSSQTSEIGKIDFSAFRLDEHPTMTALGCQGLKTTGTQKLLVVPVVFSDAKTVTSEDIEKINKAYNGASSEVGWESLSSYYEKSSYGSLDIEATIAEPYDVGIDTLTFQTNYNSGNYTTSDLADEIIQALSLEYDLSEYDQNGDKILDGFEMVYFNDGTEWDGKNSEHEVWWNFTTRAHVSNASDKYLAGVYFWSEYSMISNGYYTPDIDTHTLVHETGHMMGLDDYYSYDYDGQMPAGGVDMMDLNIGDHCAYSKILFDW
ncbi:MAG: hypothetical protein K5694_05800, partial [Bacilli bacterium]|nr:hypothetical protein [Bacilli bacterium]